MPEITYECTWTDMMSAKPLLEQLEDAGVEYRRHPVPELAGWGGEAYSLHYISPRRDVPVAVLCVSSAALGDGVSENYYYIEGLSYAESLVIDWVAVYADRVRG